MAFRLPLRLGVEPVFGWLDAGTSVNHFASGFAIPLDVQITRWFALGARFGVITGSDGPTDLNLDARDDVNGRDFTAVQLSIGPRFTLWTDEVSHEGWDFELGGGWMGRGWRLDGPGPLGEAAVMRRVGTISDGGFAADVSLGVRYQQGFGQASEFRALLLTMRGGLGFSQPLPEGEADTTPGFSYTLGLHAGFGLPFAAPGPLTNGQLIAIGLHFGLPIGPWLEARARAEFVHRAQGTTEDGNYTSMLSYAGSGVVRLRLDRVAPLYFEAGAGYAASVGTPALYVPDAGFAVFGGGFRITFCDSDSALEAGVEGRVGLGSRVSPAQGASRSASRGPPPRSPRRSCGCARSSTPTGSDSTRSRRCRRTAHKCARSSRSGSPGSADTHARGSRARRAVSELSARR